MFFSRYCCIILFTGLLSEEQCKARDVRRKQKSTKVKKNSESVNSPESVADKYEDVDSKEKVKVKANIRPETIIDNEPLLRVKEDTKTLVEKVVFLQDKYEFPDEAVIKSVNVSINFFLKGPKIKSNGDNKILIIFFPIELS
jgi:hypothetical protein